MSWGGGGSVMFGDSQHPRVFAYTRVCAAARNLIKSSLRVRLMAVVKQLLPQQTKTQTHTCAGLHLCVYEPK